jgi:hypothetical protein
MTLKRITPTLPKKPEKCSLSRSARNMGIYVLAGRGTGKSRMLGRQIAMQDFLAGFPQVIFDPVGATIDNFLDKVTRFLQHIPASKRHLFWNRIVYVDMSGKDGVVVPFPLYYRLGTERSLLEIAERYLQTIIKSNPDLFHAQVLGWPPLHRIGVYTGMVLAALGYQITEAPDLLARPEQWETRFAEVEARYPEAAPAVAFFRNEYIPMRPADRARLTTPFLEKIFTFPLDPTLRAMFGAREPGINLNDIARTGKTVLLDYRHEQDEEMRRFKMLWSSDYLFSWIKTRGRQDDNPFGIICDEFAHMTQKVARGTNPLAQDLDEFINVYMRQHTIWFTAAHQELYQIDEQLRNTLLSLGTYILGGTSSMESARQLADALFSRDPWWVKYWRPVYGRVTSHSPLEVIGEEPEFMPLAEQTELFAQRIKGLGRFQFLLRPAIAEGHIGSAVLPLTIRDLDRDKETGEYQFPEIPLMRRLRAALAKHSGIPITRLLAEQENRIPQALPEKTVRLSLPQPNGQQGQQRPRATPISPYGRERQTSRLPDSQTEHKRQKEPEAPQTTPISQPARKVVRRYRIPEQRTPEG